MPLIIDFQIADFLACFKQIVNDLRSASVETASLY